MSDDDSDPEAQGIDALRLLKQGSFDPPGDRQNAGVASTSEPTSIPLVALQPSQKRSRSLSQELNLQPPPTGSQKVQPANGAGMARAPSGSIRVPSGSQQRSSVGRDIRQHRSAPEQCLSLAKELRSCNSAPDLTIPALAAIRGLQDGTLQVDRHTRLKIAAAAKRVLEARELKRRSSQEREGQAQYPYPAPDPVSPLAIKSQPLWDKLAHGMPATDQQAIEPRTEGKTPEPIDVPCSLGTAAAIASGQSPPSTKANFHRPALGTVSQGGALISTTHRPFTVTTGVPRFAPDNFAPNNDSQTAVALSPAPSRETALPENTPKRLPSSPMVLSMADLFSPNQDKT